MKYVPGLIPPGKKILPGYFTETPLKLPPAKRAAGTLLSVCASILIITGLFLLRHPLLTFLFTLVAIVLLPQGSAWLERRLRFRMTAKIAMVFIGIVLAVTAPSVIYYSGVDKREAMQEAVRQQQQQAAEQAAAQARKHEQDSIQLVRAKADSLRQRQADKAILLAKQGSYETALPMLTSLINAGDVDDDLHYYRALCYSKAGLVLDAVNELKPMIGSNDDAAKLYDRINPLVKHVIGYETLCADGSTSSARGRGACSHHGGVANWNNPIYETSRKYE